MGGVFFILLTDMGQSVNIMEKGVFGKTHNQRFSFDISIDSLAVTAQMMASAARAVLKRASGAYTMLQLSPIEMLYGSQEKLIRRLA